MKDTLISSRLAIPNSWSLTISYLSLFNHVFNLLKCYELRKFTQLATMADSASLKFERPMSFENRIISKRVQLDLLNSKILVRVRSPAILLYDKCFLWLNLLILCADILLYRRCSSRPSVQRRLIQKPLSVSYKTLSNSWNTCTFVCVWIYSSKNANLMSFVRSRSFLKTPVEDELAF